MENQGLLFIPDISGYTQFINSTEIEHSRFIIQELLEVLINSNKLDLKISEIEGDAILFYRFGKSPSIEEMYKQVEAMFCNFHKHLKSYEDRRICPCGACEGAKELSLKVIAHEGEFSTYTVKEFSKLIGKDVIRAHQLLKNDIPLHEYWLVTDDTFQPDEKKQLPEWLEWMKGKKKDDANEIGFYYSMLSPLKENLPADDLDQFKIKGPVVEVITVQKEFHENIDTMFVAVADLSLRPKWIDGINAVTEINKPIQQIGTSHNCVAGKNVNTLITSSFERDDKTIIMEETDKKKTATSRVKLEKIDDNRTLMTFTLFLKKSPALQIMFNLFMKKKYTKSFIKSLDNLEEYLSRKQVVSSQKPEAVSLEP